jgi:hypothetical protein
VWGLTLLCMRNQLPCSWNWGLTRQILWTKRDSTSTFLSHCLTWQNKFFVNNSLTVEECGRYHFVFLFF